jgi:SAM-dependent methyltransferase
MNAERRSPTPDEYFEACWSSSDDPWDHAGRFSECRKYDLTVAALDRPRYRRAFEPGCGVGLLTERLATRCDSLVAWDRHPRAVAVAADRCRHHAGVTVAVGQLPDTWPQGRFDLVVLSEILYYFDDRQVADALDVTAESALPGATIVAVHYRPVVAEHARSGDDVHERLRAHPAWQRHGGYEEADFVLDVLLRQ